MDNLNSQAKVSHKLNLNKLTPSIQIGWSLSEISAKL